MDIYEKLLNSAMTASSEQDLPDVLLNAVREICMEKNSAWEDVSVLTEMLDNYEPYSDAGCGSETFSTKDVEKFVSRMIRR